MPSRRTDSQEDRFDRMGKGTRLQSTSDRLGSTKKRGKANIANRVVVVLRLPARLALQTERDRHDDTMSMSEFLREVVIREWLADRGYTVKEMEREAMKNVLAEEAARLAAEEVVPYALEA